MDTGEINGQTNECKSGRGPLSKHNCVCGGNHRLIACNKIWK